MKLPFANLFISKYSLIVFSLLLSISGCSKEIMKAENQTSPTTGIVWDQSTLKRVSTTTEQTKYTSYPRMIQRADKSLIAVYETDGSIVAVKSTDLGTTWSAPIEIALQSDGTNRAVPDIMELKDHTLLVCYNGRPYLADPSRKFNIQTKRSVDGGMTWKDERLLYEAGYQFENGCWEPSAVQLPSGEIQLFFANEGDYPQSNEQNISLMRSADNGLSWTKTREVVSFRPGSRDGMPVPLLLNNGNDIVFAIEDNGNGNFKPYTIRNSVAENWAQIVGSDSKNRDYALADHIGNEIYAGAPYLRQLKTGQTILSYQGTEGRTNKLDYADMKVVVGNSSAKNFGYKSTPFLIAADKSCLWSSLCVLEDNTVIAVTSTNAYANKSEIWMIKGHLGAVPDVQPQAQAIYEADPTIYYENGMYYLYGTSGDTGILVYQSTDLKSWTGPVGKTEGYALMKGKSFGTTGFWAPQVFKYKESYYMAYTANEQIAIAKSNSPLGPFVQDTFKHLSGTGKQIDPYVFFDTDGKPYLYHVKLQNGNRIFVSQMDDELKDVISGTTKECVSGTEQWENTEHTGWPVTEGPTVVKKDKYYYLIYSANDFRSKDYAVGYAIATSPAGPWKKYNDNPIISRGKLGANGTGHGDLFKDQSGKYRYVMHTHFSATEVAPRRTGIIDMQFTAGNDGPDLLTADSNTFKLLSRQ